MTGQLSLVLWAPMLPHPCHQRNRGTVKRKAMRLKVPGHSSVGGGGGGGAELPGQTPRIEGAILGGKAQERIPGLAREPGHRWLQPGPVSSRRRVLNQDFVEGLGLGGQRTHGHALCFSLLGCELTSLEGWRAGTRFFPRMHFYCIIKKRFSSS